MPIDPDLFRHTMSHFASGVTVLAVRDAAGIAHGMTASAVASLSLEPPMLLVCVDRKAALAGLATRAEMFSVSILARDQEAIAIRFADRDREAWQQGEGTTTPSGLPLVPGAITHAELRRGPVYDGGDHFIITGVLEWAHSGPGEPLLYFRSRYAGLA